MNHPSIAHSRAPAPATNVPGSHHHPHHTLSTLNVPENLHHLGSQHHTVKSSTPEFIFVEQTCPTDCLGTKCGQRHEHSNTQHGAHPTHHRTSEDEHTNTRHGAHTGSNHLTDAQRERLRMDLGELLLFGPSHSKNWKLHFEGMASADIIAYGAFLRLPNNLAQILGQVAQESKALDRKRVITDATCFLSTLQSIQSGGSTWLDDCFAPTTAAEHRPDPQEIRRPDDETFFVISCTAYCMRQPNLHSSNLEKYAREIIHELKNNPEHHGSHHSHRAHVVSKILDRIFEDINDLFVIWESMLIEATLKLIWHLFKEAAMRLTHATTLGEEHLQQ